MAKPNNIIAGTIYSPPNNTFDLFVNKKNLQKKCSLMGDFYLDGGQSAKT